MRILLMIFIFGGFLPNIAFADEFGDRFYNQAPKGLGDYTMEETETHDIAMDDIAKSLAGIMPAAGDSDDDISAEPENSATTTD